MGLVGGLLPRFAWGAKDGAPRVLVVKAVRFANAHLRRDETASKIGHPAVAFVTGNSRSPAGMTKRKAKATAQKQRQRGMVVSSRESVGVLEFCACREW
jgi:hypothetical protein